MPYDALLMFSDKQAITAAAVSTNTLDNGPRSIKPTSQTGVGFPQVHSTNDAKIVGKITTAFAGATAMTVALEGSNDNSTFAVIASTTLAAADLTAGKEFGIEVPRIHKYRYERLQYTPTGTVTAGNITAGYADGYQTAGTV